MQTTNAHQVLSERGILLPNGAISQDKINLISGAIAAPLLETLFVFAGKEASAMDRFLIFLKTYITKPGKQKCLRSCTSFMM